MASTWRGANPSRALPAACCYAAGRCDADQRPIGRVATDHETRGIAAVNLVPTPRLAGTRVRLACLVLGLASCSDASRDSAPDASLTCRRTAPVTRICNLVGPVEPTVSSNRRYLGYGVWGSDLGAPFEHDGKLHLLFGDTWRGPPGPDGLPAQVAGPDDAIAYTEDDDPDDCLELTFVTESGGVEAFHPPTVDPPIGQFALEVPLAGVSDGDTMWVWFGTGFAPPSRVLARSDSGGRDFELVHTAGPTRMVAFSAFKVEDPTTHGIVAPRATPAVFAWGRPSFAQADLLFAWQPIDSLDAGWNPRYFAGVEAGGEPVWSQAEADAAPLYTETEACAGQTSVTWDPVLKRWLMLYGCPNFLAGERHYDAGGILLRHAARPWGPWSEPLVLFQPMADGGYCNYMHAPPELCAGAPNVSDPHRETVPGFEYGSYLLPRYSRGGDGTSTIYFNLSTWNPYAVVLLKTDITCGPTP